MADRPMKRKTKRTMSDRESGYYDKPKKVRPVGADGFYSDEPEQKNIKRTGKVYDRSKGEHVKPATKVSAKKWWGEKLGFGTKRGEGALAKRRKKALDTRIKKGGG